MINQLDGSDRGSHTGRKGDVINQWLGFATPFLSVFAPSVYKSQTKVSGHHFSNGMFFSWASDRVCRLLGNDFGSTLTSMLVNYACGWPRLKDSTSGDLLCCLSWESSCLSSRSQTLTLMLALWWDYWHQSTSHSLHGKEGKEERNGDTVFTEERHKSQQGLSLAKLFEIFCEKWCEKMVCEMPFWQNMASKELKSFYCQILPKWLQSIQINDLQNDPHAFCF